MRNMSTIALVVLLLSPVSAKGDEQLTPLAISGDWAAFEHRQDMESPPDFCVASNVVERFALRADENDIEVRYANDSWSLPANVSGNLKLAVNSNSYVLPITGNTNTVVMAAITQTQLEALVADMNKASSMELTPGSAQPVPISLSGSNQVVTAFLTCANISQPGNTGGANPFQTPPSSQSKQ